MSDAANDNNKTVVLSESELPPAAPSSSSAFEPSAPAPQQNTLPVGTRLGEFEIVGIVGEGGFGIVYLAQDHSLQRRVALKEYMPTSLASRSTDFSVFVRSERHQETFEIGRRSFVNEARLLAQFDHPALVKVYRFWEANGTAYMAMPFYEGKTLRDTLLARPHPPDEHWIRKVLSPVIDSLELIHQEHCFHRDIAPDNIMLLRGDRPVLLDFGAARRVISDMTQALTVILKPGYAPVEQYAEMPGMKQGPWTDVYALAAVVYFMITGRTPPPSVGRMVQDSYRPLAREFADRYDISFLRGVDKSLSVNLEDRPQSMAEMRELLGMTANSRAYVPSPVSPAATPTAGSASMQDASPITADARPRVERRRQLQAEATAPVPTGAPPAKKIAMGLIVIGAVGVAALAVNKFAAPNISVSTQIEEAAESQPPEPSLPQSEKNIAPPVDTPMVQASSSAISANAAEQGTEASRDAASTILPEKEAEAPSAKPSPKARASIANKPARREDKASLPPSNRRKATAEEEREYMRKLNKDLDGLIRP